VTWIQEQNGTGSLVLPATTFGYTAYAHSSCCDWLYDYVTQVDNGYGARTQFTYTSDSRDNGGDGGASLYLTQLTTWANLSAAPAQPSTTTYQYLIPCYDQADGNLGSIAGAFICPAHDNYGGTFGNSPYPRGSLIGFATTTVSTKDYNGATTL